MGGEEGQPSTVVEPTMPAMVSPPAGQVSAASAIPTAKTRPAVATPTESNATATIRATAASISTRAQPTAVPTPSPTPDPLDQVKSEILEVLDRYEDIRVRSHGPSHDDTGVDGVLAEDSLKSHLEAVEWQRENNAYYVIAGDELRILDMTVASSTRADVLVEKVESREFYIDGKLGSENTVYDDHYQVRYSFKRIDGAWYIVDRNVILPTAVTTPTPGIAATTAPLPTKIPAPKPTPVASNVRDFSSTQGGNGWKYLAEAGRNSGHWIDMRHGQYKGNSCWLTDEGHVRICAKGVVHPGTTTRVAYEWRANVNRQVRVRVHAHKQDTGCGDGVKITTFRAIDGQGMVKKLGEFRVRFNDSNGVTKNYQVNVGSGVLIYVIVDIYGDSGCDATRLAVDIY